MTNLLFFSAAVVALSATLAAPAMAQQAVQEPGAAAFYQSLGVGQRNVTSSDAYASVGNAAVPAPVQRHVRHPAKH